MGRVLPASTLLLAGSLLTAPLAAQSTRPVPYWASLKADEARARTGPATDFPIAWEYRRKHLPVKVVAVHGPWRHIVDQDGQGGWIHVRLLSPEQTAVVTAPIASLRARPEADAPVSWRAERGVVGTITDCAKGWCLFDVAGRRGYVADDAIWGEEAIGPR